MRQIPDLSNSKRKNLSQEFSLLFNEAEKIRNTILSEIDSRRDMKSIEAKFKKLIKKGDLVRVKKLQKVKEKKKPFHPFILILRIIFFVN